MDVERVLHRKAVHLFQLSKLLKHISSCDQLQVSSEYHDILLQNLSSMVSVVEDLAMRACSACMFRVSGEKICCLSYSDHRSGTISSGASVQSSAEGKSRRAVPVLGTGNQRFLHFGQRNPRFYRRPRRKNRLFIVTATRQTWNDTKR